MKYLDKIIEYAILLFVFLIPWQARLILVPGEINNGYWEYGTQSLYATEVLLVGILVAVIVSCWSERKRAIASQNFLKWILSAAKRAASRMTTPYGALLLFLIYAGISVWWAIDKNTALIHWRFLAEAGAVLLLLGRIANGTYGQKIQWAIILSAVIQAAWGIGQWLTQSIPASTILGIASQGADVLGASVVETLDGRWLRAYGSFPHPNILGAWLVLGLVITIRKIQETPARNATHSVAGGRYKQYSIFNIQLLFLYASFTVILFGLLAAFSRTAWLAFGVFFLAVILSGVSPASCGANAVEGSRGLSTRFLATLGMTVIITVVAFAALFPQPFFTRINGGSRLEVKSETEHIASWQESWQVIKKHSLLGVGVGNYGLAVHRDIDSVQPAYYYQPTHNVFLLIWAELGIVGIFLMLIFFICCLDPQGEAPSTGIIKYKRFLPRGYGVETTVFLLPLFIFSFFDHYLWSLYPGMLILVIYLASLDKEATLA